MRTRNCSAHHPAPVPRHWSSFASTWSTNKGGRLLQLFPYAAGKFPFACISTPGLRGITATVPRCASSRASATSSVVIHEYMDVEVKKGTGFRLASQPVHGAPHPCATRAKFPCPFRTSQSAPAWRLSVYVRRGGLKGSVAEK